MERKKITLNRDWKFIRGEQDFPGYKGIDDSDWKTITLPHDWSVEEDFDQKYSSGTGYLANGVGWYRKRFSLDSQFKNKGVFITFEGVYNNSQVWCNSYYINRRPFGYSTFTYDLTEFLNFGEEDNVISVKVNHKESADSRWFTGSGIYRNVYLTITDQTSFEDNGVFVTTPRVSKEKAEIAVELTARSASGGSFDLEALLYDRESKNVGLASTRISQVSPGETITEKLTLSLNNPHLWSVDDPYLYTLVAIIKNNDQIIDSVKVKSGIRSFNFDPAKGFSLNGVSMKMKGVCLHHDAGCLGAAVPKSVWRRRLEELKTMGCNAIRCSHNPPSPEFLDLCDELGFLVQDEAFDEWEGVKNKWWQGHNVYPPKHFGYYEDFPEWHKRDLQGMVKRDRNHPSIVFWSIGNEIDYPNDPYCHPSFKEMTGNNDKNKPAAERVYDPNKPNAERLVTISKRLVSLVKECDTTRPVTAALSFPELSNITGLAETLDVVGYNYKEQWYKEGAEKWPHRVIYGSENSKDLEAWLTVKNSDPICAQFVWTGIDYLGEAKGWPVRVASSGFLDTAGYRKPSYYYRQSLWSESPMVQIATVKSSEKEEYDRERLHWNYDKNEPVCINVYSNCAQVELFLNDKSMGVKHPQKEQSLYASWEIPFQPGELRAVGLDKKGREYTSILKTTGEPHRLAVKEHKTLFDETGYTELDITLVDKDETLVSFTETEVQVKIAGSGTLMGLENGNIQDLRAYSSAKRSTFQGRLKAYVRQDNLKEKIRVTLKAEGMEEITIKI